MATRTRTWTGSRPLPMGGVETSYSGKRKWKKRSKPRRRASKRVGIGIKAKPPGIVTKKHKF